MSRFLEFFDVIGVKPHIYFNSKSRKKTIFGGLISIFCFVFSFTFVFYFFFNYFARNFINVIYSHSSDSNRFIDLGKIPFSFGIFNENATHVENLENQLRIYGEYLEFQRSTNGGKFIGVKKKIFQLEKCDLHRDFGAFKYLYENIPSLNKYFCLPLENINLTIFGTYSDVFDSFGIVNIKINRCFNDENMSNVFPYVECLNKSSIENNLENIYISIVNPSYDIDHFNISFPGKLTLKSESLLLTLNSFKRYSIYKRLIHYYSDTGFILPNVSKETFFQDDYISLINSETHPKNEDSKSPFGFLTFTMSNKSDHYYRNFTKIPIIFAQIAGFVKGIFCLSKICLYFLLNNNYYNEFANIIYGINDMEYSEKYEKSTTKSNYLKEEIKSNYRRKIPNAHSTKLFDKNKLILPSRNIINETKLNENVDERLEFNKSLQNNLNNVSNKIEFITKSENIFKKKKLSLKNKDKTDYYKKLFFEICLCVSSNEKNKYLYKLEYIIKKDLSVDNILKIINSHEYIYKNEIEKNLIEKQAISTIKKKIDLDSIDKKSLSKFSKI